MGGNMSGFVLPVELGPTRSCLTSSAGVGHFAVSNQTENRGSSYPNRAPCGAGDGIRGPKKGGRARFDEELC